MAGKSGSPLPHIFLSRKNNTHSDIIERISSPTGKKKVLNLKNLLNLADTYRLNRNYERAAALLDEARILPGSDEFVRKLDDHLKRAAQDGMLR